MTILGVSAFYHDSAACIVRDGEILAAAQEERFTRVRHDQSFPYNAIMFCLERCGISAADLDCVAFYEKPLIKFERILQNAVEVAPRGMLPFCRNMPSWFTDKLRLPKILKREIGYSGPIRYTAHHEAHAASAFFPSPFEQAAIITIDGVGEWTTNSIGIGRGSRIELLKEIRFPDSIGLLYSAFTEFLGFQVNSDEYKVMGLAPYGEPTFVDRIMERMITVDDDGGYRLNQDFFSFRAGARTAGPAFATLFGCAPRRPESALAQVHMDIARSIQSVTETVMLRQAAYARRITGLDNLCLAGGVALNCVANGRILSEGIFKSIWIQPAAGDAGGAAGAALLTWHQMQGAEPARVPRPEDSMGGALLGPEFDNDDMLGALSRHGVAFERLGDSIYDDIASRLAQGQVVARFAGRMEFGPRALGNRSILADARNPAMQRVVNEKIKFREGFRPFAPAVLLDHVGKWFRMNVSSPYMLLVAQVAADKLTESTGPEPSGLERLRVVRSTIPAVTHVDGSARIQTVSPESQPDFHRLIEAFWHRTGCPVVLNTSFNLRGQPIVCTPDDAVRTFLACDIDALAIGPYMALKPHGWTRRPIPRAIPFRRPRRKGELRRFGVENAIFFGLLGSLAYFGPANPAWWAAVPAWVTASLALAFGLVRPSLLKGPESALNRLGGGMNSGAGLLLFGLVHALVVTPTGLLRRKISRAAGPTSGFWQDAASPENGGGPENMY